MSKGKRYTQEFKIEAVKQITERGYSVAEVSERLGICTKTLYKKIGHPKSLVTNNTVHKILCQFKQSLILRFTLNV